MNRLVHSHVLYCNEIATLPYGNRQSEAMTLCTTSSTNTGGCWTMSSVKQNHLEIFHQDFQRTVALDSKFSYKVKDNNLFVILFKKLRISKYINTQHSKSN